MTRSIKWLWPRDLLRFTIAAILLVPVRVDEGETSLAPAFMVAAFDVLTKGLEAAQRAGIPILVTLFFGLIIISISNFRRLIKGHKVL